MKTPSSLAGLSFEGAVSYHGDRFPPQALDHERLMPALGRAARAVGRYDALLGTLPNPDLLLAPLRGHEAVVSSRMEGTVATLEEVFALEDVAAGTERPEAVEVRSYTRAMSHAEELMAGGLPICSRLIRETHGRLLFSGRSSDKRPGQFKRDQNYVIAGNRVVFIPIPPHELEDGMRRFETFINAPNRDPLLKAAIGHAEFEALHPFADGNGRVGRMLITLGLWADNVISRPCFYVSSEIEKTRDLYIDRLRDVSARDAWTEWCLYFLDMLDRQAAGNYALAGRMMGFYNEMKEVFPEVLSSKWAVQTLDAMFVQPVFTNRRLSARAGIPSQSAARSTRRLVEEGLLEVLRPGSGRAPAWFVCQRLLDIVRQ